MRVSKCLLSEYMNKAGKIGSSQFRNGLEMIALRKRPSQQLCILEGLLGHLHGLGQGQEERKEAERLGVDCGKGQGNQVQSCSQ